MLEKLKKFEIENLNVLIGGTGESNGYNDGYDIGFDDGYDAGLG